MCIAVWPISRVGDTMTRRKPVDFATAYIQTAWDQPTIINTSDQGHDSTTDRYKAAQPWHALNLGELFLRIERGRYILQ